MENKLKERKIEELLKNAKGFIIATTNGVGIEGNIIQILSLYSLLTNELSEQKILKDVLKRAFELGMKNTEEEKEDTDEKKENIKKMLDDLKEILEEI